MLAVKDLAGVVGVAPACDALAIPRASFYRWLKPTAEEPKPRPSPPRALRPEERREVREVLNSEDFVDQAPAEVYAALLDRGIYLCSVRTMYRILEEHGEVQERRNQLRHPTYTKPELLATGPNEVWSWDITKLLGPATWTYYYLYVILDIFSRYVVGWLLAERESAALAKRLIEETIEKQGVDEDKLTLHSDRGPSMKSTTVAQLLANLGVTKSHSRPHTSNDNPFSEAQFRTLKYRRDFPKRFGSLEDARGFCRNFFCWYNDEHHHSGIGLMTPFAVHYGEDREIYERRREVLLNAYRTHPERFVRRPPEPPSVPEAVWINPPAKAQTAETPPDDQAASHGPSVPDSSTSCDVSDDVLAGPRPAITDATECRVAVTAAQPQGEPCHAH
jgi:putative transposase